MEKKFVGGAIAHLQLTTEEIMERLEESLYQDGTLKRGRERIGAIGAVNFVNDEPDMFELDVERN